MQHIERVDYTLRLLVGVKVYIDVPLCRFDSLNERGIQSSSVFRARGSNLGSRRSGRFSRWIVGFHIGDPAGYCFNAISAVTWTFPPNERVAQTARVKLFLEAARL
uniref:(northern house mosquito) hypothetical protein n=1 Tax=Culex pipiens TaxID=7175 RepID=A0A8D8FAJ5_CULPI